MHAGLVSVLLPNYNGEKHLEEAIDSVLGQTYANIELIIVDDGSSDYSKTSIERYTDNRIKKIYLKRGKHISYALNQGLKYASGEYIARIDADDIWEKDKLEKQMEMVLILKKKKRIFIIYIKMWKIRHRKSGLGISFTQGIAFAIRQ